MSQAGFANEYRKLNRLSGCLGSGVQEDAVPEIERKGGGNFSIVLGSADFCNRQATKKVQTLQKGRVPNRSSWTTSAATKASTAKITKGILRSLAASPIFPCTIAAKGKTPVRPWKAA